MKNGPHGLNGLRKNSRKLENGQVGIRLGLILGLELDLIFGMETDLGLSPGLETDLKKQP